MVNLIEYKTHLINSYRYEIDNCEEKRLDRKNQLEKKYGDEYLNKIICNSYEVIRQIFDKIQHGYCVLELDGDTTKHIFLNLVGGWHSDTLYILPDGNIISTYILKDVFKDLSITLRIEEESFEDEIDEDFEILSFNHKYILYMQNFPENLDEIKNNLFGKCITKNI